MFKQGLTYLFIFVGILSGWTQKPLKVLSSLNNPIPYACLQQIPLNDAQSAFVSYTNFDGEVKLKALDVFCLILTAPGYQDFKDTLNYDEVSLPFSITMEVSPLEVSTVKITGELGETTAKKAMHKVTIISKERIEDQAAINLEDVLSNETNIRIQQDNVLGSSMSMQGISGENVKILMDGVPVIGRLGGNIDLSQINLNDVERIEVIEGPLSVAYGTNAMAGTINIITKKNQKDKLNGSGTAYYETVGQYNFTGEVGYKIKNIRAAVSGGRNFFDGWSTNSNTRNQEWNPKEQYFTRFQLTDNFGKSQWRINADYFDEFILNRGAPRSPLFNSAFDDTYKTQRANISGNYKQLISNKSDFNIVVGYNNFQRKKNTYFKNLETLEEVLTSEDGAQDTSRFYLAMSRGTVNLFKANARFDLQLGYDFNYEGTQGQRIENENRNIGDYAVFGMAQWQINKWLTVKPGLRWAHNTRFDAPVIPSFNTKMVLDSTKILKLSYGRGFRAPSLKELYFFFVDVNHNIKGNENLLAETGDNVQLNFNYDYIRKEKLTADFQVNGFYNQLQNMIGLVQIDEAGAFMHINVGKYITYGGQLDHSLTYKNFQINNGATALATYNELSEKNNISAFNWSPEFRTNIHYKWQKKALKFSFFYKYNGKRQMFYLDEDDEVQNGFISAFSMSDVFVAKSLLKRHNLKVRLGIKNIFDVKNIAAQGPTGAHSSNTGFNPMAWGRSFTIQTAYHF